MDGPTFIFFYATMLLVLLFASWLVRVVAGDLLVWRVAFAVVFISIGLVRYFYSATAEMQNWVFMWIGMLFGTILFFAKADEVTVGKSGGGGCGSGGAGGDGGGCGGGGCGGCG